MSDQKDDGVSLGTGVLVLGGAGRPDWQAQRLYTGEVGTR